jgi:hypothetical protein
MPAVATGSSSGASAADVDRRQPGCPRSARVIVSMKLSMNRRSTMQLECHPARPRGAGLQGQRSLPSVAHYGELLTRHTDPSTRPASRSIRRVTQPRLPTVEQHQPNNAARG